MDAIQAIRSYINKILEKIPGPKVLFLDEGMKNVISLVAGQSDLLKKEVFLIEMLGTKRSDMKHMKGVLLVRPTADSVNRVCEELKAPKCSEYGLFFSNIVDQSILDRIAEADEGQLISQVHEIYADFLAISPTLASFDVPSIVPLLLSRADATSYMDRIVDGLGALLLSLKMQPVIRYSGKSLLCREIADTLSHRMESERSLFDSRRPTAPPVLLIMDRRDDPISPLLNQWTYQAMVGELIGIQNNIVDLRGRPNVSKTVTEAVLSSVTDEFFRDTMYLNFGDLAMRVKAAVERLQQSTPSARSISSLDDMKRFFEQYPDLQRTQTSVTLHVSIVSELSRLVAERDLFRVSALEQDMSVPSATGSITDDLSTHRQQLIELIVDPKISATDKLRLAMLFRIRYELDSAGRAVFPAIDDALRSADIPAEQFQLYQRVLEYCGQQIRSSDLFGTGANGGVGGKVSGLLSTIKKRMTVQVKGAENVYTQHQPLIASLVEAIVRCRLREQQYPYARGDASMFSAAEQRTTPQDVIVFVVGGATFEESMCASTIGERLATGPGAVPGVHVLVSGTSVVNSSAFLEDLGKFVRRDASMAPLRSSHPFVAAGGGGGGGPSGDKSLSTVGSSSSMSASGAKKVTKRSGGATYKTILRPANGSGAGGADEDGSLV